MNRIYRTGIAYLILAVIITPALSEPWWEKERNPRLQSSPPQAKSHPWWENNPRQSYPPRNFIAPPPSQQNSPRSYEQPKGIYSPEITGSAPFLSHNPHHGAEGMFVFRASPEIIDRWMDRMEYWGNRMERWADRWYTQGNLSNRWSQSLNQNNFGNFYDPFLDPWLMSW